MCQLKALTFLVSVGIVCISTVRGQQNDTAMRPMKLDLPPFKDTHLIVKAYGHPKVVRLELEVIERINSGGQIRDVVRSNISVSPPFTNTITIDVLDQRSGKKGTFFFTVKNDEPFQFDLQSQREPGPEEEDDDGPPVLPLAIGIASVAVLIILAVVFAYHMVRRRRKRNMRRKSGGSMHDLGVWHVGGNGLAHGARPYSQMPRNSDYITPSDYYTAHLPEEDPYVSINELEEYDEIRDIDIKESTETPEVTDTKNTWEITEKDIKQ